MIGNKRVVVVIPSGRKRYMDLLIPYVSAQAGVDEIRLWVNTKNPEDLAYIHNLSKDNGMVTLDESAKDSPHLGTNTAIRHFFKNCCDADTVYVRFDDDVIFIENDFVSKICHFKLSRQDIFLALGNIINNALCDYIHKEMGVLNTGANLTFDAMCQSGWANPMVALEKHANFLKAYHENRLHEYKFDHRVLNDYPRFSINAICWEGKDFQEFGGAIGHDDEEEWLTRVKPSQILKPNAIFGQSICVHFSFHTQRRLLDSTNLLDMYRDIYKLTQ